jgi:hypothetical protein
MLTYFAVFSAVAVCAGWIVVRFCEWRMDVLYGPYAGQDRLPRKGDG